MLLSRLIDHIGIILFRGDSMKQICIYNFVKSFDKEIVYRIIDLMKGKDNYFLSRNWEGGPHVQLILSEEFTDKEIDIISEKLKIILSDKTISKELEESIKEKYEESSKILFRLENKKEKREMRNHGYVEVRDYEFYYHNNAMTSLFIEKRFELQELIIKTFLIVKRDNIDISHLFPVIFSKISDVYSIEGINKGYFSFISHVHGFFELSSKQNKDINESKFEEIYMKNIESIKENSTKYSELVEEWYESFNLIYEDIKLNLSSILDEAYKINLKETISELEIGFQNDFHKNFVKFSKNTEFMENDKVTAYRFLLNLLYLILPFFSISAYKKQQYIYMAYRIIEEKKGLTWREEIGIVN